jgi:hypothetical protein
LKFLCNVPRGLKIIGDRGFPLNKKYLVDFNFCDTERGEMDLKSEDTWLHEEVFQFHTKAMMIYEPTFS